MRATREQLLKGLRHPDWSVRHALHAYFHDAGTPDAEVVNIALDCIERVEPSNPKGWYEFVSALTLPMDEDGLLRVLEHFDDWYEKWMPADRSGYFSGSFDWVAPELVAKHLDRIQQLEFLRERGTAAAEQHAESASLSATELLTRIETAIAELMDESTSSDAQALLRHSATALARHPEAATAFSRARLNGWADAQKMEELLDESDWPELFRTTAAAHTAGAARHDDAADSLAQIMVDPGEWLSTAAMYALAKLQSQAALDAIFRAWATEDPLLLEESGFKLNACHVLAKVHVGQDLAPYQELFTSEVNDHTRTALANAMLSQFDSGGIDAAWELIRRDEDDTILTNLPQDVVAVAAVLECEVPDLVRLQQTLKARYREAEERARRFQELLRMPSD